ncbi:MAG TPA: PVC-type heme-binding CxxCH protein [Tepidisphaeraceae bacterium]|nr:PVC-type heme-binding CxxCH protein [Tepidisphaeraceae bacterium]
MVKREDAVGSRGHAPESSDHPIPDVTLPQPLACTHSAGARSPAERSLGVVAAPSPPRRTPTPITSLLVILLSATPSHAAEPEVTARDLPPFPPVEPANAPATLKLRPGVRADLVAAEPLVASPVAAAFDEDARLYVVEMRDYPHPEQRDQKLGRIRLLFDDNDDGVFDRATVFAKDLGWPTAVICWDGGVFVACTPDILYLKDTDKDGVADVRKTAFTGLAAGATRLNVQALANSFNWGLDNRIYLSTSTSGAHLTRVDYPTVQTAPKPPDSSVGDAKNPLILRNQNLSSDPRTGATRAEGGGGQHGLSFDDFARPYLCANSRHLMTLAYDPVAYAGSEFFTLPPPLIDIAADGPAAEVFRASPEEPWRVLRTKWRVGGLVPGPIEGGGRSAGYFTGATGATIFRGTALGAGFAGDAFIGDAGGNLVHRKRLKASGAIVEARRADDELKSEFLASTDTWFRPVQFANGPDGALYVLDMYRQTIEHPWSLPDSIKKHLDLTSGRDRGRVWRISAADWKRPPTPKLSTLSTAELAGLLAHANGWTRDTAARLIYQRQDPAAPAALRAHLARGPVVPTKGGRDDHSWPGDRQPYTERRVLAGLHALYALDGLGALTRDDFRAVLTATDPSFLAHLIRLAHRHPELVARTALPDLIAGWLPTSPSLRFQAALALANLNRGATDAEMRDAESGVRAALRQIVALDVGDPWAASACLTAAAAAPGRAAWLVAEIDRDAAGLPGARRLLPGLAQIVGHRAAPAEAADVLTRAAAALGHDAREAFIIARSLAAGLRKANKPLDPDPARPLLESAAQAIADPQSAPAVRAAAAGMLGYAPWDAGAKHLFALLAPQHPQDVQIAALAALDTADDGRRLAPELIDRWPTLSPAARPAAAALMTKRPARAAALLRAIEANKVRRTDLTGSQIAALRQSTDRDVRELAARLLTAPASRRDDVIKNFAPALTIPGDATRGLQIYLAKCAACHRHGERGSPLGPDLETVRTAGREKLLTAILDPSREVFPQYAAYALDTTDGDTHLGLIAAESELAVTLKMAAGMDVTVPRPQIKSLRTTGLSIMPEGLEDGMKSEDIADLLAFIEK